MTKKFRDNFLLSILFIISFIIVSETIRSDFFCVDLSFLILTITTLISFFIRKFYNKEKVEFIDIIIFTVMLMSIWMSIIKGNNLKDIERVIYAGFLLNLPKTLSIFIPFSVTNKIRGYKYLFFISFFILLLWEKIGFLKSWNANSIAYLLYFGITSLVICILNTKKNKIYWILYIISILYIFITKSRGVSLSLIFIMVLILNKNIFTNKIIYRISYMFFLLYPMLFTKITLCIKNEMKLYELLLEISIKYFNKTQVFSGRDMLFEQAQVIINQTNLGYYLGYGKTMDKFFPAHNTYFILMYLYGLIGCLCIFFMYIIFFEKAYKSIKLGDNVSYGCVCIIFGMCIQLATESYFIGISIVTLMPFVYFAIILVRYDYLFRRKKDENFNYYTDLQ
ncbi:hypothetical protein P5F62_08650 [Clostridium perfringens]|nr:hypothetical protein [Clostridium perfringens]